MWKIMGLAVGATVLSGCITQVRRVPKNWDHASDPGCTESYGPVVGDAAIALVGGGGALLVADQIKDRDTAATVAVSGLALGAIFAILAAVSYDDIETCVRVNEEWRVARATARREAAQRPKQPDPVAAAASPPRGFFCASSPSVPGAGLRARERSACEQARDAAAAAVPDLGACVLVETAWCFALEHGAGDRCAATQAGCAEQLGRAGATGECEERR